MICFQCVLFNDLLVFASKGDSKQSEVELVLDLSVVWLQDLEDLDPQSSKFDIELYPIDTTSKDCLNYDNDIWFLKILPSRSCIYRKSSTKPPGGGLFHFGHSRGRLIREGGLFKKLDK